MSKLTLNLNLPSFNEIITAEVEVFFFKGDLSVGVDDTLDIESVVIDGRNVIQDLTEEELQIIYQKCWKQHHNSGVMDFSYLNYEETDLV